MDMNPRCIDRNFVSTVPSCSINEFLDNPFKTTPNTPALESVGQHSLKHLSLDADKLVLSEQ